MKKSNFDKYLDRQMEDPDFARRFRDADAEWNIALQIAELRKSSGLSQAQLARRLRSSQQQVSRLESPSYEGHSIRTLRQVAEALGASIEVRIHTSSAQKDSVAKVGETKGRYRRSEKSASPRKRSAGKSQ